ncbi:MAG: hypothetical protein WC382_11540 [Methanoregulaceae archaeon]
MKGYAFPAGFLMSMPVVHITRREQLDVGDEIFIAALSVLSIIMVISMKPGVYQDAVDVLFIINAVLTLLVMHDSGIRVAAAQSRPCSIFRESLCHGSELTAPYRTKKIGGN